VKAAGILDEILKTTGQQVEQESSMRKKSKCHDLPGGDSVLFHYAFFGLMIFVMPNNGKKLLPILGGQMPQLPIYSRVLSRH